MPKQALQPNLIVHGEVTMADLPKLTARQQQILELIQSAIAKIGRAHV